MHKVKVKKLTGDDFGIYGSYADMLNQADTVLATAGIIFRDMLQQNLETAPMPHSHFVPFISGR